VLHSFLSVGEDHALSRRLAENRGTASSCQLAFHRRRRRPAQAKRFQQVSEFIHLRDGQFPLCSGERYDTSSSRKRLLQTSRLILPECSQDPAAAEPRDRPFAAAYSSPPPFAVWRLDTVWGRHRLKVLAFVMPGEVAPSNRRVHSREQETSNDTFLNEMEADDNARPSHGN
jgi:hypothetical protein